jgi:hypothetical protein
MRSINLQSFMLMSLIVLELCPGQCLQCKNEQKAITPKVCKTELWFFYTAPLHNEIYLPTRFHADTSCCFKVMSRTRIADRRSDERTKRRLYAHPLGSIIIFLLKIVEIILQITGHLLPTSLMCHQFLIVLVNDS